MNVVKIDALHPPLDYSGVSRHQPGRGINSYGGFWGAHGQQASLQCHAGDADNTVAAHGAVTLVMHEEHADVRFSCDRRGNHADVHVGVTPCFPHEGCPQVI